MSFTPHVPSEEDRKFEELRQRAEALGYMIWRIEEDDERWPSDGEYEFVLFPEGGGSELTYILTGLPALERALVREEVEHIAVLESRHAEYRATAATAEAVGGAV